MVDSATPIFVEKSKLFLHKKVGLSVRSELENVAADNAKAVFFVETLCSRVKFPYAQPHNIAAFQPCAAETGVHQFLTNALA